MRKVSVPPVACAGASVSKVHVRSLEREHFQGSSILSRRVSTAPVPSPPPLPPASYLYLDAQHRRSAWPCAKRQPSTRHSATAAGTRRWGPEGAPWKGRCMAAVAGSVLPLSLQLGAGRPRALTLHTPPHPLGSSPLLSSRSLLTSCAAVSEDSRCCMLFSLPFP